MNLYLAKYRQTTIDDTYIVAADISSAQTRANEENSSATITSIVLIAEDILIDS